ncbi:hypothetical protein CAEBREN_02916 [Caenorhabditis brenneri]|uniref:SPK domain-containing protein n=1 Tax=Caenorhabditis brenneri TaxID=135651 RepID=G0MSV0_CAEBE|nr:hypothetical protein CAEBREN_02916 [Caenorhabditis brenneri]
MAVSTEEVLQFFLNLTCRPDGFKPMTDYGIYLEFWLATTKDASKVIPEARKLVQSYEGYTFQQAVRVLILLNEPVTDEFIERSTAYGTLHLRKEDKTVFRFDEIAIATYTSRKLDDCPKKCAYFCMNQKHKETWVLTPDEARKREERSWPQVLFTLDQQEKEEKREKARLKRQLKRQLKNEYSAESQASRSVSRGTIENASPDEEPIKPVQHRRQKKLPSASPHPESDGTSVMTPHVSPPAFSQQSQPGSFHQPVPIQNWFNQANLFATPPLTYEQCQLFLQNAQQLQQNQLLGLQPMHTFGMAEYLKIFSSGDHQNGHQ